MFIIGDTVLWNDPDQNISSGEYEIIDINGETIVIENTEGSTAEVNENEITLV